MISLLTGRAGLWAGAAFAVLIGLAGAWWLIDSRSRLAVEVETQDRDIKSWERVNDADVSRGDAADDLEWMRRRAAGQR